MKNDGFYKNASPCGRLNLWNNDMEREIEINCELLISLREIGFPLRKLCFKNLMDALVLISEDESYSKKGMMRLYKDISDGDSPMAVERRIRYALEKILDGPNRYKLIDYLGDDLDVNTGKITTYDFIKKLSKDVLHDVDSCGVHNIIRHELEASETEYALE